MNFRQRFQLATPAKVLFLFTFFVQFVGVLYSAGGIELPPLFDTIQPVAFLWLSWWWLKEDSRQTGVSWPLDMGMFLYMAWIVVLPYHLFKTRGPKGFLAIIMFIGVLSAAWITAAIISVLIWF